MWRSPKGGIYPMHGIRIGRVMVRLPLPGEYHGETGAPVSGWMVHLIYGGVSMAMQRIDNALTLADDISRFAKHDLVGITTPDDLAIALGRDLTLWSIALAKADRADTIGPDYRTWLRGAHEGNRTRL